MIGMEQQFQEKEAEAKAEFQSLRDEIKSSNIEETHALRVQVCFLLCILFFWKNSSGLPQQEESRNRSMLLTLNNERHHYEK